MKKQQIKILGSSEYKGNLVVWVEYPESKILVFKDTTLVDIRKQGLKTPFATFELSDESWDKAMEMLKIL